MSDEGEALADARLRQVTGTTAAAGEGEVSAAEAPTMPADAGSGYPDVSASPAPVDAAAAATAAALDPQHDRDVSNPSVNGRSIDVSFSNLPSESPVPAQQPPQQTQTQTQTQTQDEIPRRGSGNDGLPLATARLPTSIAGALPVAPFVTPSSYLRLPTRATSRPVSKQVNVMTPLDKEQIEGLRAIRAFLKVRTSYDVLPLSYRLIILDTSLLVKKSLNIMTNCAIVSAPLWDSNTSTFEGLLTTSDYMNVVQYYWQNPDALHKIDQFRLSNLREIERAIGVTPIETVSIHPLRPLYEACRRLLASRARRIPLVDKDDETQRETLVSVITQYRILKFITVNVKETQMLRKPLREIKIGTYENLASTTMDMMCMDCIHMLVQRNISSIPILDKDGTVLNVFEAVDVIALLKGGDYDNLNLSVGKALEKRSDDFPGIYTCTLNDRLDTIFDTIRKSRVHRLVVIDEDNQLKGMLSLSDILDYTLNSPLGDGDES